jgi:hypothetical protein
MMSVFLTDLKLSKSRFEEDAFQIASTRAKPGRAFCFLPTLWLLPFFTIAHNHDSLRILIDIFGILNVLLAYVHLSYQALVLNYMKSIRGYYCFLGLSCPLLIILFIFHLSSLVYRSLLLGDETKVVGHDESHHTVI